MIHIEVFLVFCLPLPCEENSELGYSLGSPLLSSLERRMITLRRAEFIDIIKNVVDRKASQPRGKL